MITQESVLTNKGFVFLRVFAMTALLKLYTNRVHKRPVR